MRPKTPEAPSPSGISWRAWLARAVWAAALGLVGCNAVLGLEPSTLAHDVDAGSVPGDADPPGDASGSAPPPRDGSSTIPTTDDANAPDGAEVVDCSPPCGAGLACERIGEATGAAAACFDPGWAEWPIPNAPADVSGGAPNVQAYTDNHDGTVTDDVTGLMWQQVAPTQMYSQTDGSAYCQALTLGGHRGWRLPTQIELTSIVNYGRSYPSIDVKYFTDGLWYAFWSSTPATGSTAFAYGITFIYGDGGANAVITANGIRCVR